MIFPWFTFALLFVAPFIDPRHPLRLLHLDLIVLVGLGMGTLFPYEFQEIPSHTTAVAVLGLVYLAVRLLSVGFRPKRGRGPLVPLLPANLLLVALLLVIGARYVTAETDRPFAFDVGLASVAGADRIGKGNQLYGEIAKTGNYSDAGSFSHLDTYGPVISLAYVPFEQLFPWGGGVIGTRGYDDPDAAHVAPVAFDLLVIGALFLLGRQIRPGPGGRVLGLALAYAWASFPYTLFQLRYSFNDSLVALLVIGAFLALRSPPGRGALTALAGLTKVAPLVLAPLLATGTGERRGRSWTLYTLAFLAVSLAVILPFVPDGGLEELWDRTLGFQQDRAGQFSVWSQDVSSQVDSRAILDQDPPLDWLQNVAQAGAIGLALLLAFVPRRRSLVQLLALGGGLLAAVQLTMTYWFSSYLLWFAPLALAAFFTPYESQGSCVSVHGTPR
jgi:Glycosyltransferase family 87